jgi:hypothetical protein
MNQLPYYVLGEKVATTFSGSPCSSKRQTNIVKVQLHNLFFRVRLRQMRWRLHVSILWPASKSLRITLSVWTTFSTQLPQGMVHCNRPHYRLFFEQASIRKEQLMTFQSPETGSTSILLLILYQCDRCVLELDTLSCPLLRDPSCRPLQIDSLVLLSTPVSKSSSTAACDLQSSTPCRSQLGPW